VSDGTVDESSNSDGGSSCTSASLGAKYVKDEIGTGFDKALSKGRLVPHNKDSQLIGFKIIGLDPSGLFGKACLKNGDVITQVNETSLQQPDQGFTFYQAFQEEQKIRLSLLRNGTIPMTINIEIK
jgi:type II secretory pathway component PulC